MCLFGYYMAKLKGFNYPCCSKSVVTTSRRYKVVVILIWPQTAVG